MNKIYFMLDSKSGNMFEPFIAPNDAVALRSIAGHLKDIREKKLYTAISVYEDSELCSVDLSNSDKISISKVEEYRKFFSVKETKEVVQNENKNLIK